MDTIITKVEQILTSEYNTNQFVELIQEIFSSVEFVAPDKFRKEYSNFSSHIEGSTHIGNYCDSEGNTIVICSVKLHNHSYVENSRSVQRNYAKKLIENAGSDAAFIAFYTEGDSKWRISFVRLDYEIKFENGKLKTAENITPAKRYSYLVGTDEPCHTAIDRFRLFIEDKYAKPSLDEIEEAFSVEAVTNEFFKLYCEKFHQVREHLEANEDFVIEAQQHNFTSSQFTKKLLGQIVFLYFLQKKGWLGVNALPKTMTEKEYKNAFYAKGVKSRELIPRVYKKNSTDNLYYLMASGLNSLSDDEETIVAKCVKGRPWGTGPHNFMRKLFETAEKKNANFFDDYLEPLFYSALNVNRGEQGYDPILHCRIPFLSGGLFEPIDGYEWEHNDFALPNTLFSNRMNDNTRTGDGILDIFDRYNFTMSEDEPLEREVAIDPEMLGKVFENLLDIDDRKSKGAFYTPREIVHHMCQECLITYLTNELHVSESAIREFILFGDFMKGEDTVKEKRLGNESLYISEELFKLNGEGKVIIDKLHEMDVALKNVRVADLAVGSGAFPLGMLNEIVRARQNISSYFAITMKPIDIHMMYTLDRSPYALKYETIKNCIYASDIEPSAVDIAQLRLWLSLVIDDEINPNADPENPFAGHRNPTPLPNLECNILCGNSLIDEFNGVSLINQSLDIDTTKDNQQINLWNDRFESILPKLIDAQDRLFSCDNTSNKQVILQEISSLRDLIIYSQIDGIFDKVHLQEYQESKHMASKPYILWQLDFARVFKEKGGFDIVIGNPPYIKERDNKEVFEPVNSTTFGQMYHQGKMDYWFYFLHKAIDLINPKGNISFITPRYWLNSAGASNLIKRIKNELSFVNVVDIGKLKVFDNVVGYHMIAQYSKEPREIFTCKKLENSLNDISKQVDTSNIKITKLKNSQVITDNYEIRLENNAKYLDCKKLGDIAEISQGVVEASDRISKRMYSKNPREDMCIGKGIFVLTYDEMRALNLTDYEMQLLKPYVRGENVKRYRILPSNEVLIYSDKEIRSIIESSDKALNIKAHLDYMSEYITSSNAPYGLHRPRNRRFFENEKILLPSMFAENDFAIDYSKELYAGMSFNCIIMKDKSFSIEYILAILNSSIAKEWFYSEGKKRGAGVDIGVEKLRSFPIKDCDIEQQHIITNMVKMLHNDYEKSLDIELDDIISKLYTN